MLDIPTPSAKEVEKYLKNSAKIAEHYHFESATIRLIFLRTFPKNADIKEVLVKVCVLNDFYSTNIKSVYQVAQHIVSLGIDKRLKMGDKTLVNDIAKVKMSNGKTLNFYSFATKYCANHFGADAPYAIYDSFVAKMLWHFSKRDKFAKFAQNDLRDYPAFEAILRAFMKHYGLEKFSFKEIDSYLWLAGKENF